MKKQLTAVLLSFALLLALSGCSAVRTLRRLDAAEDRIVARLDAAEDKLEDSLRNAVVPAPTVPPTLPAAPAVPEYLLFRRHLCRHRPRLPKVPGC